MAIDRTCEFQPILDVLTCLEVSNQDQNLILDVLESHLEAWIQMQLPERAFALQSALRCFKYSTDFQGPQAAQVDFERCLMSVCPG